MKKFTFVIIVFFVFTQLVNAQFTNSTKKGEATTASFVYKQASNCSPYTAMLLADIKQNRKTTQLIEQYGLVEIEGNLFVSSFIVVDDEADISQLTSLNIEIETHVDNIYTATIPISNLEKLLSIQGIDYVEIGQKVELMLDQARAKTWVDEVHSGTNLLKPYTGEGVVVGIIDGGFDYTHPVFYNSDYTDYRISRVWNQDQTGTPPSGFSYGNELIGESTIVNAGYSSNSSSHGTHVAGIAAGSGSVLPIFKGVAYNSELVLVAYGAVNSAVANGIDYIFNYASSAGKPAVINMSLGKHIGPHDGTSIFDQFCDGIVGPGKILVGAAGNEGSDKLHLNANLGVDETVYSFVEFPSNANKSSGSTYIDIWGEATTDFTIAINIFNIEDNTYQGWTEYVSSSTDGTYEFTIQDPDPSSPDVCTVSIAVEHSNSQNNKPHMFILFDNTDQDEEGDIYDYVLLEVKGTNTHFDAWCSTSGEAVFSDKGKTGVTDGNTNITIGETGGTGNSIISVGAFTSKNNYVDYQGNAHDIGWYAGIGTIAPFSSLGPTVDGRTKPDIVAPGNAVVSSVNSFQESYNATNTSVVGEVNNGTKYWWFAQMPGTSMASPMVTGIIALWLESRPNLTTNNIKQLMYDNAFTDGNTGSVPNNTWGWGKIDAHKTMAAVENFNGIESVNSNNSVFVYPNPSDGKITLDIFDESFNNLQIFDITGKLVYSDIIAKNETKKDINISNLTMGIYVLKLTSDKYALQSKLLINK